jgi:nucleotide-binding universal stress UspA family protein
MKILIAYDGSASANAMFEDLKNAGLPGDVEALVMSVADVFIPLSMDAGEEPLPVYVPEGIKRAHKQAELKLKEAEERAVRAGEEIKKIFPGWKVNHLALADSPAWAILREAEKWGADLIVAGAQGHSVLGGRLILGSISQRVIYEAGCSVRVGRKRNLERDHPRLLIGLDNSPFSRGAVEAVCRRGWPAGTDVRLLAVVNTVMAITPDSSKPSVQKWIEVGDEENWDEVAKVFEPEAEKLRAAGLNAAITIRKGNPADEILEEAEAWNADCIFLGPKGARGIERLLLGSVSSAVSARATCSVEIVRARKTAAGGGEQ